jgi:ubiquitin carboxyl-terminal hydrolase MINDY-3/4
MGDREEDEELQMALRMSLQGSPPAQPEPKRSKPPPPAAESPEAEARRKQRELMAAAAEKRRRGAASPASVSVARSPLQPVVVEPAPAPEVTKEQVEEPEQAGVSMEEAKEVVEEEEEEKGEELPPDVAENLWAMVFGRGVSKAVLAQWSNQGIR